MSVWSFELSEMTRCTTVHEVHQEMHGNIYRNSCVFNTELSSGTLTNNYVVQVAPDTSYYLRKSLGNYKGEY